TRRTFPLNDPGGELVKSIRLAVLAALAIATTTASAATFIVPSDRQLVDRSDAVVTATVRDDAVRELADGRIVTDYHLIVDEALKGALPHEIVVSEFGGALPGKIMFIEDSAVYQPGQRVM